MLEQIHLIVEWLPDLTKILEDISTGGGGSQVNPNFRLLLTTDPSLIIPIGILERSILIIIEAASGIKPRQAVFNSPKFDNKDGREKNIFFALCYFHSMMFERKRYGRIGYNMNQPFNVGNLLSCGSIFNKQLENLSGSNIPWVDLKYLFGEIMQGWYQIKIESINQEQRNLKVTIKPNSCNHTHFQANQIQNNMKIVDQTKKENQKQQNAQQRNLYQYMIKMMNELMDRIIHTAIEDMFIGNVPDIKGITVIKKNEMIKVLGEQAIFANLEDDLCLQAWKYRY